MARLYEPHSIAPFKTCSVCIMEVVVWIKVNYLLVGFYEYARCRKQEGQEGTGPLRYLKGEHRGKMRCVR